MLLECVIFNHASITTTSSSAGVTHRCFSCGWSLVYRQREFSKLCRHLVKCESTPDEAKCKIVLKSNLKGIEKAYQKAKAVPYYLKDAYIYHLIAQFPTSSSAFEASAPQSEFAKLTTKERERVLVNELSAEASTRSSWHSQEMDARVKAFWIHFRNSNKHVPQDAVKKIQDRCRHLRHRKKLTNEGNTWGMSPNGTLLIGAPRLPFQREVFKELPLRDLGFVPGVEVRQMSPALIDRVSALDDKLQYLLVCKRGEATKIEEKKKANFGYSLARTIAPGGHHSNLKLGISGSIHFNQNIVRHKKEPKREEAKQEYYYSLELQQEVIDVVSDVIIELYGGCRWYKAVLEKLADIPEDRFLCSRGIPCSHIWYTTQPQLHQVHTDTDSLPPAFVFSPKTVKGGELIIRLPGEIPRRIHLKAGTVVGGSWAQYPHCNDRVLTGNRRSFVVYLDHRAISQKYVVKD